jgi:hypothetical protein
LRACGRKLEWVGTNPPVGLGPFVNFRELRKGEVRRNPLGERMNNRLIERGRE